MKYAITYSPEAQEGLAKLKRSEPASFKKAVKLLNEMTAMTQVPVPTAFQLGGFRFDQWEK
ncbi:hypothetical protein [uncultured Prevotella sp.]|uniref:hypothetical protein n=1 Tax=uncultured Prevotella sp. TaxID=159272 RepID=UPI0025D15AFA|nr:hypothetical protein [uncultured Prevotella sp.]